MGNLQNLFMRDTNPDQKLKSGFWSMTMSCFFIPQTEPRGKSLPFWHHWDWQQHCRRQKKGLNLNSITFGHDIIWYHFAEYGIPYGISWIWYLVSKYIFLLILLVKYSKLLSTEAELMHIHCHAQTSMCTVSGPKLAITLKQATCSCLIRSDAVTLHIWIITSEWVGGWVGS